MLVQNKKGNISTTGINGRHIDLLPLEWYETRKRILKKSTRSGKEISLRFLNENPELAEGDILFENDESLVVVSVLPCKCIVVKPASLFEMASVCYEIGNKHLPLFFEKDELLIPADQPLLKLLSAQGYDVKEEERKLLNPLKTTVTPHGSESSATLFSKIMKLTTPAP